MTAPFLAFNFGLVQDVAVLRPLILLARAITDARIVLLQSAEIKPSAHGIDWNAEIARIGRAIEVEPIVYRSPFDALLALGGGKGAVIAGSESTVRAHHVAHQLFKMLSGQARTVTLQHGYECVGFLHNARHDETIGRHVRFAADVVVSWFPRERLSALAACESDKLFVAGPPGMIQTASQRGKDGRGSFGLVCENLHSVRFSNQRLQGEFISTLAEFCRRIDDGPPCVLLRPHPASLFSQGLTDLPEKIEIQASPIYDAQLETLAFGISAPSTIVFDLVQAGVPTAVWRDSEALIDTSNYAGLPIVSSADDLLRLRAGALRRPGTLINSQRRFIERLRIPGDVASRYSALLHALLHGL